MACGGCNGSRTRRAPRPGGVHQGSGSGPVTQAEGSDDAFADGVHPWRPRQGGDEQGGDDPQSFSLEHLGERGGEERIAIMNQEPQRVDAVAQVQGQVAGLLHRPRTRRVRGHSAQVHSSDYANVSTILVRLAP